MTYLGMHKETPSEERRRIEVEIAIEYIHECMYEFSDKKIIWLAEKCFEIDNYKRKNKKNG